MGFGKKFTLNAAAQFFIDYSVKPQNGFYLFIQKVLFNVSIICLAC